jgi:hypothetical protein
MHTANLLQWAGRQGPDADYVPQSSDRAFGFDQEEIPHGGRVCVRAKRAKRVGRHSSRGRGDVHKRAAGGAAGRNGRAQRLAWAVVLLGINAPFAPRGSRAAIGAGGLTCLPRTHPAALVWGAIGPPQPRQRRGGRPAEPRLASRRGSSTRAAGRVGAWLPLGCGARGGRRPFNVRWAASGPTRLRVSRRAAYAKCGGMMIWGGGGWGTLAAVERACRAARVRGARARELWHKEKCVGSGQQ